MRHRRLSAALLHSISPSICPNSLAEEVNEDTQRSQGRSKATIRAERPIIASRRDEVRYTVARAEGDEASESADDDQDWAGSSRVGVEKKSDRDDVAPVKAQDVASK